jgi:hypothetical protein
MPAGEDAVQGVPLSAPVDPSTTTSHPPHPWDLFLRCTCMYTVWNFLLVAVAFVVPPLRPLAFTNSLLIVLLMTYFAIVCRTEVQGVLMSFGIDGMDVVSTILDLSVHTLPLIIASKWDVLGALTVPDMVLPLVAFACYGSLVDSTWVYNVSRSCLLRVSVLASFAYAIVLLALCASQAVCVRMTLAMMLLSALVWVFAERRRPL